MTIDKNFAARFAADWIDAWNHRDLERVLAHYSEDFEMVSPLIVQVANRADGRLQGKQAVGAYWAEALRRRPELKMELLNVLVSMDSIVLYYRGPRGLSAEAFFFGADGKVSKAVAHYAPD
jgi:ketosteroid isomerase-like protein